MKRILLLLLFPIIGVSQIKTSNPISIAGLTGTIELNSNTQVATLKLVGPSDRWIACQFGEFNSGMQAGTDVVYFNGTNLIDATHNGIGNTPTPDTANNWTVTQNNVAAGTRTLVATRPFNSPDSGDYDFVYANTTIDIAIARGDTASFALAYHGPDNKVINTNVAFTDLGVEDFSLKATQIYPNPSNGEFLVKAKTTLEKINIYSQTGAFIKTVNVNNETDNPEINVTGLQTGVYLLELVNASEKSWKKIIVN
jgi:hypothetical protein